ncbi:MAG: IS66 family transposase [Oscillospiraceae bacterium]|nr:IS66 family transposase [Oscillospiraceae bacterium]
MSKDKLIKSLQQELKEQSETIASLHRIIDSLNETGVESHRIILSLNKTISGLQGTIDELNQRIKELSEQLGMNSRNSSKPPSSDEFNKPSPKSLRGKSGKKAGGQPGHKGSHLDITIEPDEIVLHVPTLCRGCPNHESCVSQACVGETRKVVDAVVTVNVTAHQSLVLNCPLYGIRYKGEFPEDIKAPVQYGENLQALVVAMNTVGAVSVNRTHEILSGVFGIPLSTGTIVNMVNRCAYGLTGIIEFIRQRVAESTVGNFDETGTNVDGKKHWVHTASNLDFTHLRISANRGQIGMDAGGVLPNFSEIAVHDCWSPYWKYPLISHALCCAHLLRELIAAQERHPEQKWATDFIQLILKMKETKEQALEAGETKLSAEKLRAFDMEYDRIIKLAHEENTFPPTGDANTEKKRGRKKKGKTLALIERLEKHKVSVCLFINNFDVPFDNNLAERDIRMVKTKTKVSGCFRSLEGAKNYLKIMSFVGTAKKHGKSAFVAIRNAISGNPDFFLQFT